MSTRSNVIIKVKPEDIGKTFKFVKKNLPVRLSIWGGENRRSMCKPVTIEKPYVGIYCHWDGYPSGVGKALFNKFKTYEDVLNLVVGGDCSVIDENEVLHYANREGEKWDFNKPVQNDKLDVCGGWTEYAYIFEDGAWKFGVVEFGRKANGETNYDDEYIGKLRDLEEVLKEC